LNRARSLSILQVVPSVNPRTGGPAASVPGLARALSRVGVESTVVSLNYAEHGEPVELPGVRYLYSRPGRLGRRLRGWSPSLRKVIDMAAHEADIVHSHALWMVPALYARRAANRLRKPLVISPRGMLDAWSLERSRVRKAFAARLYENRNLRSARLLHATSELEAESIRRYGLRQPIAVLPNGIELPPSTANSYRETIEGRFPELRGHRWLLFLGRLDIKKGLDLLLALWRELASRFPEWRLVVAGPDLDGFGARMAASVSADPQLRGLVTFTGMLRGSEKHAVLRHSELFVLPTRGENFGIAVAEALAHGTPAITTTAAPWSDLVIAECGWWVAPEEREVREALTAAMRLSANELAKMGERGREWVKSRFAWDSIGMRWVEIYRWILDGGTPPPCVLFE
jgi:glycosyltransferase involved in cell wall biosynthesis